MTCVTTSLDINYVMLPYKYNNKISNNFLYIYRDNKSHN